MCGPLSQGEPLPDNHKYRGQWIYKNLLFVYVPDDKHHAPADAPQFTVTENQALGFSVRQLAAALDIQEEDVLRGNQDGSFCFAGAEEISPPNGVGKAKRYIFRYGDKLGALILQVGGQEGKA